MDNVVMSRIGYMPDCHFIISNFLPRLFVTYKNHNEQSTLLVLDEE